MNDTSNSTAVIWTVIVIIIIAIAAYFVWGTGPGTSSPTATTTTTGTNSGTVMTTVTPGGLSIPYDTATWSLAAAPEPIINQTYIPPCDQGYDYCFYLASSTYPGTNFEGAGVRVNARPDLATQAACLNTQPTGYTGLKATTTTNSNYAVSAYAPLGDAAMGHYSTGALYRLYYGSTCYELQSRIGQTQFANYPAGTIKQFTAADQAAVAATLANFLNNISIASTGAKVTFPPVSLGSGS